MKLDRKKFNLARARACIDSGDLVAEGIPRGTLYRVLSGTNIRSESMG